MSNAIAQSATLLSVSTPTDQDLVVLVQKLMVRGIRNPNNNATTQRLSINFNKVLNAAREMWKSTNGGVQRVPDEVDKRLQEVLQAEIISAVNKINPANAVSYTEKDVADFKNLCIYQRVSAIGKNYHELEYQFAAANRLIRETKDKLEYYRKQDASGNSTTSKRDYPALIIQAEKRIQDLNVLKAHVKATLISLGKLKAEQEAESEQSK